VRTYGVATETDTLLRVEDGTLKKKKIVSGLFLAYQDSQFATYLPDEGLDTTGTTVDLVKGDLTNDLVTILPVIASVMIMIFGGRMRRGGHTCGAS
jgi:hypothetical protein